jgi:anti-sigma regulatory factor (Ser/Thr protein kinase)
MDRTTPISVVTPNLRTLRIRLPAHPASAGAARRHVRAVIDAWDIDVDAYVAALLASELVTNALMHGVREDETIRLVITSAEDWMRVSVHDSSRAEPVLTETPVDAEDGRGMTLLASLSACWGFQQTATGKAVYFMLKAGAADDGPADVSRNGHWRAAFWQ